MCVRSWAAGECGCSLVSVLVTHTQTQLLAEKSHPREEARCYDTDSHKPSHLPEDQANDLQANFTGCGEDATPSCYSRSTPAGVKNRWQKLSGSVYEQSESFHTSPPGTTLEFLNKIHVIKMWSETWSEHTTSLKTCLTDGEPDSVFLLIINENISSWQHVVVWQRLLSVCFLIFGKIISVGAEKLRNWECDGSRSEKCWSHDVFSNIYFTHGKP